MNTDAGAEGRDKKPRPVAYLVTDGEYSDYNILGVFSSRIKAAIALRTIQQEGYYSYDGKADARIEEHELDPDPSLFVRHPVTSLSMTREGVVTWHETRWPTVGDKDVRVGFDGFVTRPWEPVGPQLDWTVATASIDRATKVVSEKRGEILAAGIWGDEDKVRAYFSAKAEDD